MYVGYQAQGISGHVIQTCGPKGGHVDLDGERINICSSIATICGYSAHADQKGLMEFVTGMQELPSSIREAYGERQAKQVLADTLKACYA